MTKTHWQFDKKRIFYFNKRLDNTDRCLTCPKHEFPRTSQNMFNTSFALYMITTIKKKKEVLKPNCLNGKQKINLNLLKVQQS